MVEYKRIIDISLPLEKGIICYPGDTPFCSEAMCTIARSGCNMSQLTVGTHTGTHIDAPLHFLERGKGVDELPLERFMGMAQVVEVVGESIGPEFLQGLRLSQIRTLLFKTRNSLLLEEKGFRRDYVHLTADGAACLVEMGIDLVGIDYLSIERFGTPDFAVHKTLLEAGISILEGLDLRGVAPGTYFLIALPLRITGGDGSPLRAVLLEV